MLKDYLNQMGRSIYAVSKETGIPYSTLNDLANDKVQIGQCRVGLLRSLAQTLGLSLEETCGGCAGTERTVLASLCMRSGSPLSISHSRLLLG